MPRRINNERGRAYRRRVQREAEERREELTRLEEELHREWAEQHLELGQPEKKHHPRTSQETGPRSTTSVGHSADRAVTDSRHVV